MASMAVILAVTAAAATAAAVGMELGPVGACVALGGVIAYKTNSKLYIAYIYDLLEICNMQSCNGFIHYVDCIELNQMAVNGLRPINVS